MSDLDKFTREAKKALEFYSLGKLIKDAIKEVGWKETDDLLLSSLRKDDSSGLFLPENLVSPSVYDPTGIGAWTSYKFSFTASAYPKIEEPKPDSSEFETNMIEALMGWREWFFNKEKGVITGVTHCEPWFPEEAASATCKVHGSTHLVPAEFCTCGFYALNNIVKPEHGYQARVYGQVYGWGRYVRGNNGWRCQFAYPKSFYACEDITPDEMDILKKYHVPIYVKQPILMYNPEEDGYEHRNDEANWNLGSSTESDADQDSYEGQED